MRTVSKVAVVLMLALAGLSSFTLDNPRKYLIKKWMIDKEWLSQRLDEQIAKLAKEDPEQAEQMKAQKELMLQILGVMTMNFRADGTGETTSIQGVVEFEWTLSKDGTQLTIKDKGASDAGETIPVKISENRLVMGNDDDNIVFIPYRGKE